MNLTRPATEHFAVIGRAILDAGDELQPDEYGDLLAELVDQLPAEEAKARAAAKAAKAKPVVKVAKVVDITEFRAARRREQPRQHQRRGRGGAA